MEALLLAAGNGERMKPLTEGLPKPLLPILDKPNLIWHILKLKNLGVKEVHIVARKKEPFESVLEDFGLEANIIIQPEPKGTGDAVLLARDYISDEFALIYGDVYLSSDFSFLKEARDSTIFGYMVEDVSRYGSIVVENGKVKEIREKSESGNGIVFAGVAKLDSSIFDRLKHLTKSPRGEYELTDVLAGLNLKKLPGHWVDLAYPWNLLEANKIEMEVNMKSEVKGVVEEVSYLHGKVYVGEDALIKSGSYVEGPVFIGPGCIVGPNAYLRAYTVLVKNVKVGSSCEVKNSVIMEGTKIPHHNYVGDSIIGRNCNFGAGTKVANLRFDRQNVKVKIKGQKVDTGLKKFGAVIGHNVQTGINVSIYPGIKIGSNSVVGPGTLVYDDVERGSYIRVEQKTVKKSHHFARD